MKEKHRIKYREFEEKDYFSMEVTFECSCKNNSYISYYIDGEDPYNQNPKIDTLILLECENCKNIFLRRTTCDYFDMSGDKDKYSTSYSKITITDFSKLLLELEEKYKKPIFVKYENKGIFTEAIEWAKKYNLITILEQLNKHTNMKTIINKPYALNEIGGRDNNEDSIYPLKGSASKKDALFLVCDGVGGADKGEIASQLVCEGFAFYFEEKPLNNETLFDEDFVKGALEYTQNKIDDYLLENPDAKGMGTTLTMLHFNTQGATIAHVGDSRVYQIRNGEIVFKTKDHSFVNQLVDEGIITEEEAKTHAKRNIITRAIQGNSVKPTKADVFVQTDIQAGDYFFLCTDGILEQITDEILVEIITANTSDEEKIQEIDLRCKGKTKDNYSCYLIPVKDIVNSEEEDIPMGTISSEIEDNTEKNLTSIIDESVKSISKIGNSLSKSISKSLNKFFKNK